jgi:hypothetical protein
MTSQKDFLDDDDDDVSRIVELEREYAKLSTPHSFWAKHAGYIELDHFRGHNQFLSQDNGYPYRLIVDHIKNDTFIEGIYNNLDEDHAFGCVTTTIDGKTVSRDLLDSVLEISFLESSSIQITSLSILDIGAGYGRFAHRLSEFSTSKIYCTDAIPVSTMVCEKYIHFRQLKNVHSVPLHELESLPPIDLAVNIHSWSECTSEGVNFWLDWLVAHNVSYLFVSPHEETFDTDGPLGGPSFRTSIESHGYNLIRRQVLHFGPRGFCGDFYFYLFELGEK